MVEVKFDFPEGESLSHEHYFAVRVGEAQKISRIGSSRVYKFPKAAVGNRRYGRLDILKRVGSSTLCLDGEAADGGTTYHVKIDNAEIDFKTKVSFADSDKPEKPAMLDDLLPEKNAPERLSNTGKVAAARAYLETHHLEARISDAMQAVLRERPEDPTAFLARRLLDDSHLVLGLPKPPQAEEKAIQEVKQPAPAIPRLPKPPQAEEKAIQEVKQAAPAQLADLAHKNFPLLPSVGSWYTPKPRHSKVRATTAAQQPATRNFSTRPSVGTWLSSNKCRRLATVSSPVRAPAQAPSEAGFAKRPSVGTWLAVKPKDKPAQVKNQRGIEELRMQLQGTMATRSADGSLKTSLQNAQAKKKAKAASSQPLAAEQQSKEQFWFPPDKFSLKPSVGTWLSSAVAPSPEQPKRQAVRSVRCPSCKASFDY